jgi:hypothetical protein
LESMKRLKDLPIYRDSVTRFSNLGFFHQSTPPRALIQGLNTFRIWLRISWDNRFENRQNRIPRWQWHHGIQHFCQSFRLIFTFTSNCMRCLPNYLFFFYSFPLKGKRANVIRFPRSH